MLRPELVMVDVIANATPQQGACVLISAEMDSAVNYFVYRDAGRDCVSVLVRRTDGHLDLIES